MENISEKSKGGQNSTFTNKGSDMKSKIKEKKEIIQKSISTLEEAKAQYEELQVQFKRLDGLEDTLRKDIKNYKDKLMNIHSEMSTKFDRIEQYKDFLKDDSKRMKELMVVLEKNKENYNKLLTSLILKNRSKSTQLEDNELFKKLRELEKKMQDNENFIYSHQTFIESKVKENDYSALMKECMDIQHEINNELIKKYH
jgi:chromosome segregation ATPase